MQIDRATVLRLAELSKLSLDESEEAYFIKRLDEMIEYMSVLDCLDTSDVIPSLDFNGLNNVMREDKVLDSFDRELLTKNARLNADNVLAVPKTVE